MFEPADAHNPQHHTHHNRSNPKQSKLSGCVTSGQGRDIQLLYIHILTININGKLINCVSGFQL